MPDGCNGPTLIKVHLIEKNKDTTVRGNSFYQYTKGSKVLLLIDSDAYGRGTPYLQPHDDLAEIIRKDTTITVTTTTYIRAIVLKTN